MNLCGSFLQPYECGPRQTPSLAALAVLDLFDGPALQRRVLLLVEGSGLRDLLEQSFRDGGRPGRSILSGGLKVDWRELVKGVRRSVSRFMNFLLSRRGRLPRGHFVQGDQFCDGDPPAARLEGMNLGPDGLELSYEP